MTHLDLSGPKLSEQLVKHRLSARFAHSRPTERIVVNEGVLGRVKDPFRLVEQDEQPMMFTPTASNLSADILDREKIPPRKNRAPTFIAEHHRAPSRVRKRSTSSR
ncbi:MAG: hypothetical protein K8M05_28915 [Deltaproteobacteria bacterium]|nr:hypothetical protein [Kofleriaceae bacterium]